MQDLKDVIESVQHYYSEAFSTLFYYTLALIAFSGALIPVIVAFFQNKTFKSENEKNSLEMKRVAKETEDKIKRDIDVYFDKKEKELLDKIELRIDKTNSLFDKKSAASEGKIFHIQAIAELQSKAYLQSLTSAIASARNYAKAGDEANLQRVVKTIEANLSNLNKVLYSNGEDDYEALFESLIESIESVNENGRYRDMTKSLKKAFSNSVGREKP